MAHRQLVSVAIKVQLIKIVKVGSGGLIVAFWTAAQKRKATSVWWFKIGFKMVPKLNTLQWSTRILVVVNTLQAKFPQTIWIWTVNCKWLTIINTLLKSIVFTVPFKNNDKNCAWITFNSIFTDTTLCNLCSETQLLISDVRNTILAFPYTYFAVPLCLKCIFRNHSLLSIYTIS